MFWKSPKIYYRLVTEIPSPGDLNARVETMISSSWFEWPVCCSKIVLKIQNVRKAHHIHPSRFLFQHWEYFLKFTSTSTRSENICLHRVHSSAASRFYLATSPTLLHTPFSLPPPPITTFILWCSSPPFLTFNTFIALLLGRISPCRWNIVFYSFSLKEKVNKIWRPSRFCTN